MPETPPFLICLYTFVLDNFKKKIIFNNLIYLNLLEIVFLLVHIMFFFSQKGISLSICYNLL